MKSRLILYITSLVIALTSCSLLKNPDTEGKLTIKSKHNDDNIIFTSDKIYTYEVNQKNKNQTIKFDLTLQVIPGNYNYETKIKYKYYYNEGSFSDSIIHNYIDTNKHFKWEITSIGESKEYVWIHPPRSYSLEALELAPFPKIHIPPENKKSWEDKLWIGPGWGEYSYTTIKQNYKIISLKYITDTNFIATISTSSTSKIGNTTSEYTYDSERGFTLIKYNLPNESVVILKMKKNR